MNIGPKTGKKPNYFWNNWQKEGKPNWEYIETQAWFTALYDCPQEPDYHAEGNVGVHTKMVVEALYNFPEFQKLSIEKQEILALSALLHDVAKPICTIAEEGKISSPKHAKIGEKLAREILWDMDLEKREEICSLVRFHGLPLWILEKSQPLTDLLAASLRLQPRDLYLLAKADVIGRICNDQNQLLERLEFFKEFALEKKVWNQPFPFYNAHSQFRFFFTQADFPSELFDDTKFQITLMSGIPGSGKDFWLKKHSLPVISLDDLRKEMDIEYGDSKGQGAVIQKAYQLAKQYAAQNQSFIWNATNLTTEMRGKLIGILSPYNPFYRIVYIETTRENIFQRRYGEIPKEKLEKMFRMMDFPQKTEAHEVIYLRV